jgi:hypothetical protein
VVNHRSSPFRPKVWLKARGREPKGGTGNLRGSGAGGGTGELLGEGAGMGDGDGAATLERARGRGASEEEELGGPSGLSGIFEGFFCK